MRFPRWSPTAALVGAVVIAVAAGVAGCHDASPADTDRAAASAGPLGWGPDDLRSAYRLPAEAPESGTIALITVGPYPTLSENLSAYRSHYGLTACTASDGCLTQIDYHGGPALPAPVTAADKTAAQALAVETAVDVDMASAICPACHLLDVQIPTGLAPAAPTRADDFAQYADAFGDAVNTAVDHGAAAVSISFTMPGSDEMLNGPLARSFDHPGVAIVAAAGDYGFNGSGNSLLTQGTYPGFTGSAYTFPQALPTVTAAGGTTMIKHGDDYVQGAWSLAGSGCTPGGGPAIGQPPAVSSLCGEGMRAGADVSAVADGIAVYVSYRPADNENVGWIVLSGTSLAAPQIAAMYAAGGRLHDVRGPNTLYAAPSDAFTDVTSGTNAQISGTNGSCTASWQIAQKVRPTPFPDQLCAARRGWDGPTGLGVPRGLGGF